MTNGSTDGKGAFTLSHFELPVSDLASVEDFYVRILGFAVTDRGAPGPGEMVFLSRDPSEHHQLVLRQAAGAGDRPRTVDHFAFRVGSLAALRGVHGELTAEPGLAVATVSHGTTWSVYFQDPEGNRLEVFVDTPWHVDQPVRFEVDLTLPDDALTRATEAAIRDRSGFRPRDGSAAAG